MTDHTPPDKVNKRHYFQARFDSLCRACDNDINEGDWVSRSNDDSTQIICTPCAKEEDGET